MKQKNILIGIVAIEISGDYLGAGLMKAIKKQAPNVQFIGIGGPKMSQAGLNSSFPLEDVAVIGIGDVLRSYFKIKKINTAITRQFLSMNIDVFIGVDGPDFNLRIAENLKRNNIKTVQYVSPKVWASRPNRVFKIKKIINLMLCLFPFEVDFYSQYNMHAVFVGHPLADDIGINPSQQQAKKALSLTSKKKIITVLPASRAGELKHMGPLFIDTMRKVYQKHPNIHFIVPTATSKLKKAFEQMIEEKKISLPLTLLDNNSQLAFAAADIALVKSGTGTLECLLSGRPMVVALKFSKFSYAIIKRLITVKYVSLPNLLANRKLVSEFIQDKACSNIISKELISSLSEKKPDLIYEFNKIHMTLRQNANRKAASAILNLLA